MLRIHARLLCLSSPIHGSSISGSAAQEKKGKKEKKADSHADM
jgi:hypothetical protein